MVEGARLESVYTGNRIAGSNPAPSAKLPSLFVRRRTKRILFQWNSGSGLIAGVHASSLQSTNSGGVAGGVDGHGSEQALGAGGGDHP